MYMYGKFDPDDDNHLEILAWAVYWMTRCRQRAKKIEPLFTSAEELLSAASTDPLASRKFRDLASKMLSYMYSENTLVSGTNKMKTDFWSSLQKYLISNREIVNGN